MPAPVSTRAQQFRELVERGELQGFEDLWMETLDVAPADVQAFLAGIDALESQGLFDKVGLYLSMLTPVLLERELWSEALQALRKMAAIAPRERGLRHGLLTAYRSLYADKANLEALLELAGVTEGKDLKEGVEKIDTFLGFTVGRYLFHPGGWFAGRVTEVDAEEASVVIDFMEKRGHRMSMEMAAKKTEFIADTDIRAMKLDRLDELKTLVEEDPVELIRCALRSRRNKCVLRDLRDRITSEPDVIITTKVWSRWWQKTRTKVKSADDITITPGANPTLELGEKSGGYAEACLRDLRHIATGSRRVRYFRDLMKEAAAHEDGEKALTGVAQSLIEESSELEHGPQISLAFLLDEAKGKWPVISPPDDLSPSVVVADHEATLAALPYIPVGAHRVAAVIEIQKQGEVDWLEFCCSVILGGAAEACDHCLHELVRAGAAEQTERTLAAVLERYRDYPRAFLWYLRNARVGKLPESVRQERMSTLLEKALVLHSHLDVAGIGKAAECEERILGKDIGKVFPLRDFEFIRNAFVEASESEAQNLASLLRNNRSLQSDLRDHMLANMFRVRPEAAKTEIEITDPLFDPNILYTTARSLEAKKAEYEDVVNRQIPENAAEIGRAASHGDLSENSEWTAALEKQGQLTHVAEELGDGIGKARIIDRSMMDSRQKVTLGSRATVTDAHGVRHEYTVLGPWDVDSNRGFISYQSPLGKALIGHGTGESVSFEVPSGKLEYSIVQVLDGLEEAERSVTVA